MACYPGYLTVKKPHESKKDWNFPYNGGEWPEKEDWYWVWTGTRNNPVPSDIWTEPKLAWWDNKKMKFLAMEADVYAWRRATRLTKKTPT